MALMDQLTMSTFRFNHVFHMKSLNIVPLHSFWPSWNGCKAFPYKCLKPTTVCLKHSMTGIFMGEAFAPGPPLVAEEKFFCRAMQCICDIGVHIGDRQSSTMRFALWLALHVSDMWSGKRMIVPRMCCTGGLSHLAVIAVFLISLFVGYWAMCTVR